MKKIHLIKTLATAGISASMLISASSNADHTEPNFPAIVDSATLPADMADWINNPTKYSWNPVNVRLGSHPDRPDGVIYIFPDEATADAWCSVAGSCTTPPAGVPDDAVAYVHWALDNDSGEFPGIMAKTDDVDFQKRNCIMASGETIPFDIDKDGNQLPATDKTCGNGQGTSKRFKLVVLKADTPIDLVFNTTTKDLVFDDDNAVCDPSAVSPDENVCDNLFRNYRYIMKWGNGTGTDTVSNPGLVGTRLAGFQVELGYGVGDGGSATNFVASTNGDGLSYELSTSLPGRYFDKVGENIEVWIPTEFATISPSMFSLTIDDRTTPIGGFWDKAPAGIYPPATANENMINSGFSATTANYFDVAANQGAGTGVAFPANMFGYLMYYGIFADGDPGNISSGIYIDDDGTPETEGSLYAWWDGSSTTCCYRWGIDGSGVPDGKIGPDAFGIVDDGTLAYIASRPLDDNPWTDGEPRFEIGYTDDLGGLNTDTYIKLDAAYDTSTNAIPNTFTVRFTAHSTASAGLTSGDAGVDDGDWVSNPPAGFDTFPDVDPVNPIAPSGSSDSGWCAYNPNSRGFDPVLPGLILGALAFLGWRLRKKKSS